MNDEVTPVIERRKRFSLIWLIPLVAVGLGVWMVVHAKLSEGPKIQIRFDSAEGLVANKTKVRYLNVEVGIVETVGLTEDKQRVMATVQLDPMARDLLREDTQFWVVRARVGAGGVSGLGTLLGGAYIELSPGSGDAEKLSFVGLESPPLTPLGTPGRRVTLLAPEAGSVSAGDAVLYNGYKVGRIDGMHFDSEEHQVRYEVFIEAPYDQLVNRNVRFWNVSGIEMKASASGIELSTGSLDTVLLGGVAFALPDGVEAGDTVEDGEEFVLHPNFSEMQKQPYRYSIEYVMEFEQSLRGLLPGAPVMYRGLPIGEVEHIMIREAMMDPNREDGSPVPVLISFEPARLGLPDTERSIELIRENLAANVANGLRGGLETGNLITGSLFVSIDYYPHADEVGLSEMLGYQSIPTVRTGLKYLEEQVSSFVAKLNELPLDETLQGVDQTMLALRDTLESMDAVITDAHRQRIPAEISETLADLRKVLEGAAPDSTAYQSLSTSLSRLNDVLYNVDELTRTLKDQPNSLLLNPKFPEDPIPGTKR